MEKLSSLFIRTTLLLAHLRVSQAVVQSIVFSGAYRIRDGVLAGLYQMWVW